MRRLTMVVVIALLAAACGSIDPLSTQATVGEGGELAGVEPLEAEIGSVPRFEWNAVDGAVIYKLAVGGPAGPIWFWEGSATSVNLGGLEGDRPEQMLGPVVVPGTFWSVGAYDAEGRSLTVIGPIEIAPDDDAVPTSAVTSTTNAELVAEDLPDPCTLVAQEDVDALFGGNPPDANQSMTPGPGGVAGGRSCSWSKIAALWVSVFVSPDFLTSLERCDYCSPLDGLGDEAWGGESDLGSGGAMLAVVVDGIGVQVRADGLGASVDDLLPLVRSVLGGLPG